MKNRCPSEQNTKTIRIGIGDYILLAELSRQRGVTFAEALHLLIMEQTKRQTIVVPRSQIPIPMFRVAPVTSIAVNRASAKHSALAVKPKGGKYE